MKLGVLFMLGFVVGSQAAFIGNNFEIPAGDFPAAPLRRLPLRKIFAIEQYDRIGRLATRLSGRSYYCRVRTRRIVNMERETGEHRRVVVSQIVVYGLPTGGQSHQGG